MTVLTDSLPEIVHDFLALPEWRQTELSPNGFYHFSDHGKWVPITDHFPNRHTFYNAMVTVHTLNAHRHEASKTGVPLTDDYRLLLASAAQYLNGIYVVHNHDTITRINLPDGSTLTGENRKPWREPVLPCACSWCEECEED